MFNQDISGFDGPYFSTSATRVSTRHAVSDTPRHASKSLGAVPCRAPLVQNALAEVTEAKSGREKASKKRYSSTWETASTSEVCQEGASSGKQTAQHCIGLDETNPAHKLLQPI